MLFRNKSGKMEEVKAKQAKQKKKLDSTLSVFTKTLNQLVESRVEMLAVVDTHQALIAESQETIAAVEQDLVMIDNVTTNLRNILGTTQAAK